MRRDKNAKHRFRAWVRNALIQNLPEWLKPHIYRRMIKIDIAGLEGLELRIAKTKEELEAAFRLLHDNYVRSGFMNPHESGMRLTPYHLLPSTTTLIACLGDEVVGTVSLVRSGSFGTPLEAVYDISSFHKRGERIAEVSSLAISSSYSGHHGKILFPLLNYLYSYCKNCFGVDYLAIAVNPAWWDFYRHILLFEELQNAKVTNYSFVNGAPAVGGILNLRTAPERYRAVYGTKREEQNLFRFLGDTILPYARYPKSSFGIVSHPVMTPELIDYFFRQSSDVLEKLTDGQREALWDQYEQPEFRLVLPRPNISRNRAISRKSGARHDVEARVRLRLGQGATAEALLKNVSKTGALLIWDRGLRLNEEIEIELNLNSSVNALLQARVAWSNKSGLSGIELQIDSPVWQAFVAGLEVQLRGDASEFVAIPARLARVS